VDYWLASCWLLDGFLAVMATGKPAGQPPGSQPKFHHWLPRFPPIFWLASRGVLVGFLVASWWLPSFGSRKPSGSQPVVQETSQLDHLFTLTLPLFWLASGGLLVGFVVASWWLLLGHSDQRSHQEANRVSTRKPAKCPPLFLLLPPFFVWLASGGLLVGFLVASVIRRAEQKPPESQPGVHQEASKISTTFLVASPVFFFFGWLPVDYWLASWRVFWIF
jgi:hypothetical protein